MRWARSPARGSAHSGRFEPFDTQPRLMVAQVTSHPRSGIWDKSGRGPISQGEVRHACTKRTLARLRPGRSCDPGRGNWRGRAARAEHLIFGSRRADYSSGPRRSPSGWPPSVSGVCARPSLLRRRHLVTTPLPRPSAPCLAARPPARGWVLSPLPACTLPCPALRGCGGRAIPRTAGRPIQPHGSARTLKRMRAQVRRAVPPRFQPRPPSP